MTEELKKEKLLVIDSEDNKIQNKQFKNAKEIQKKMDELKKYGLKSYFLIFPEFTLDYQMDESALHEFNNRVLLFINETNKHLFDIGMSQINQRFMNFKDSKKGRDYFG